MTLKRTAQLNQCVIYTHIKNNKYMNKNMHTHTNGVACAYMHIYTSISFSDCFQMLDVYSHTISEVITR